MPLGRSRKTRWDDGMNLLGDNIYTLTENTETLINASKEVRLELNAEESKYMLLSCPPECRAKS
jgi:hypothetical protein